MEKEAAYREAQKVLDKGAGVFVEAFYYHIVLHPRYHTEVEWQKGKDSLEETIGKP